MGRTAGSKRHHELSDLDLAARIELAQRVDKLSVEDACRRLRDDGFTQLVVHDGGCTLRVYHYDNARRHAPDLLDRILGHLERMDRAPPGAEFRHAIAAEIVAPTTARPELDSPVDTMMSRRKKILALTRRDERLSARYEWLCDVYLDRVLEDVPEGSKRRPRSIMPRDAVPLRPLPFTFLQLNAGRARLMVECEDACLIDRTHTD